MAPNWLKKIVPSPDWYDRYGQRIQESRFPKSKEKRNVLAVMMGTDGIYLLDAIWSESAQKWLRQSCCRRNSSTSVDSTILCRVRFGSTQTSQ